VDAFCRSESLDVGEPIAGSAVANTDVWLALEYDHAWGAKAVTESGLPQAVVDRLEQWPKEIPGARVQLIRGGPTVAQPGSVTLLVGVSGLSSPGVVRLRLPTHEAAVELDVGGLVTALRCGEAFDGAEPVTKPVVLVCTNGKRDQCCAKWGLPIYNELAGYDGIECWQTTHLGGHRFAPTLLCLPEGICYGRLGLDDLEPLVRSLRDGAVFAPDRALRGRTCLSAAAQAAEVHWRASAETPGGAMLVAVAERAQSRSDAAGGGPHPNTVVVTLTDGEGATHVRCVQRRALGRQARPSCAKLAAPVAGWFPLAT